MVCQMIKKILDRFKNPTLEQTVSLAQDRLSKLVDSGLTFQKAKQTLESEYDSRTVCQAVHAYRYGKSIDNRDSNS